MNDRIAKLIQSKQGVFLDVACGDHKQKGSIGMDKDPWTGVDIVHNMLDFPWPLPDAVCYRILASHIIEHLPPDRVTEVMNEFHRLMKVDGQLMIAMPYGTSSRALQDPSHYRCWIEATPLYYTCDHPLYACGMFHEPGCWKIQKGFPQWSSDGDLTVIFDKRGPGDHGAYHRASPPTD